MRMLRSELGVPLTAQGACLPAYPDVAGHLKARHRSGSRRHCWHVHMKPYVLSRSSCRKASHGQRDRQAGCSRVGEHIVLRVWHAIMSEQPCSG